MSRPLPSPLILAALAFVLLAALVLLAARYPGTHLGHLGMHCHGCRIPRPLAGGDMYHHG